MYHALYRKYRPHIFDDVIGQESIIKTLKNSIINKKYGHAYMFFGPRGTGKTTISKIFARSVNCLNPIDGNSCGKCKNCLNSYEKECVDIIEMDAASNNGVDEIRELRNKISLVPAELNYKVYIIDEVHMLSIGAFNALLKTLEEPPEHAIFILATTDPQKVPDTIISRCQCFSFSRISENKIVERLKYVCEKENIDISDDVLLDIAISSDGGLRDALGMLDKLSVYTTNKITYDDYISVSGLVTKSEIKKLAINILNGDMTYVLQTINNLYDSGKNLVQVFSRIIYYIKDEVVNYYLNGGNLEFDLDSGITLINSINEKMFDIKKSDNPKIYIEIFILNFMGNNQKNISREIKPIDKNISNSNSESKIETSTNTLEDNTNIVLNERDSGSFIDLNDVEDIDDNHINNEFKPNELQLSNSNIKKVMNIRVNNTFAKADKNVLKQEIGKLNKLNDFTFDQEIGYLVCEILNSKFRVASDNIIVISYEYDSIVEQNLLNLEKMEEVYNKITNSNKSFAIISDSDWEKYKVDYIKSIKSGTKYTEIEEPDIVFENIENNDIISSSAIDLFGDIVEVE